MVVVDSTIGTSLTARREEGNRYLSQAVHNAQNPHFGAASTAVLTSRDGRHNGGTARGYQAILVPLATPSSPGYAQLDGQPAVYLYIAAVEMNVLICRWAGALLLAGKLSLL